ncbi:MAG TPA: methylated-DNA--[protein]-cysteine S-methyltransferase [Kofleriaceae bacterium]|nr:methylated-DNA--[protein]-cysteine S-methyltransferase [Kofleriaceae bacterium]
MTTELVSRMMPSPIGPLRLVARADALVAIDFPDHDGGIEARPIRAPHPILDQAREELDAYFAGKRNTFTVPLAAEGTPFQQQVWDALVTIPFGETWSYGQLARAIRRPSASRAVGAANGRNPLPIIVPCHRVIGASGSLVGFGGGLPTKKWLLAHEQGQRQLPLV